MEEDVEANIIMFTNNTEYIQCPHVSTSAPPGGAGGEGVALVAGGTGTHRAVIDDLAVGVGSAGSVRALAGVLAPVVEAGPVLGTLAVVEALSSPAGHQGIAPVAPPGERDSEEG